MPGFKASSLLLKATAVASSEAALLEIDDVTMENFCSASDDIHNNNHKAALFVSIFIDFTSNIINNFTHSQHKSSMYAH